MNYKYIHFELKTYSMAWLIKHTNTVDYLTFFFIEILLAKTWHKEILKS